MHRITLDLEGTQAVARLCDDLAPVTVQRLLDHLPFEDRFTHSIWSGLLIHSNNHPPLDLDVGRYPLIENPVSYLAPGDVVVWPHDGTVGIAYGATQFRWLTGALVVSKFAAIEGDLEPFARAAYRMMFEGARGLRITAGGEEPAPRLLTTGDKLVEIEYEGERWVAELLADQAPEYALAVWNALPLEGVTTITHSSGEVLHFWCTVPEPARAPAARPTVVPVEHRGEQVGVTSVAYDPLSMRGQLPGDLIWGSTWNGIRIVYGQGHFGATGGKLGRIVQGDLESFARKAQRIPWDGAGRMRMRRYRGAL